jgi:hypothetical protein
VPFPADYGGVIDVYYRIKALHELGYKINLHCFEYGRGRQDHLQEICAQVHYYDRPKTIFKALQKKPFVVTSRASKKLLNRLLEDPFPILFEGLHTTWFLRHPEIQKRQTMVRTHNIEHDYYRGLAEKASFPLRLFFRQEAKKLQRYESILKFATKILCIRSGDLQHFRQFSKEVFVLPASMPKFKRFKHQKTDKFALFHGNLSVSENETAAIWIIEHVWKKNSTLLPLKIAGKNPSKKLQAIAAKSDIELISNPSNDQLNDLLQKTRIHVLISDQATGVKLKLLLALQTSGHVLVNPEMVSGTELGKVCTICSSSHQFLQEIEEIQHKEFTFIENRFTFMTENFDTVKNCQLFEKIIE